MSKLFVLLWCVVLFVATCTDSPTGFVFRQTVHFHPSIPRFADFFRMDISSVQPLVFLFKTGHFIGFAILDALLAYSYKNRSLAFGLTVLFAVATEVLQLYFSRDGRLYDVLIDSAGAGLFYLLGSDRRQESTFL